MNESSGNLTIQADWLISGDGRVIRNGVLHVRDGVVQSVEAQPPPGPHREAHGMAILPGLINAHTHLELSHLRGQLPRGVPMPEWISHLVRLRSSNEQMQAAVVDGARQALAGGTTAVVDISHSNLAWPVLAGSPLRRLCLAEVLGRGVLRPLAWHRFMRSIADVPAPDEVAQAGISPHAPYTTSPAIYRHAARFARRRGWPLCTHLAETPAEREFLMHGRGELADWARKCGLVSPLYRGDGMGPVDFAVWVEVLGAGGDQPRHGSAGALKTGRVDTGKGAENVDADIPVILAHCNDVDDREIEIIARSGASAVYCPGSSEFFGRSGHRYRDMLQAGVNVAIGTDSLASNDSLDMLAEMRRVAGQGRVDSATILRMATTNGAAVMGRDDLGTLAPGKAADFILVPVSPQTSDPLDEILRGNAKVAETFVAGHTTSDTFRI